MKNYLELAAISARTHRKRNGMSIFCIALAVFLVAAIFGMADMFIRSQMLQTKLENGTWHIAVTDITDGEAERIAQMDGVSAVCRYGVLNFKGKEGYTLGGKDLTICGVDESYGAMMLFEADREMTGRLPHSDGEAFLVRRAGKELNVGVGDRITVDGPDGSALTYTVSGFFGDIDKTSREDSYAMFVTTQEYRRLFAPNLASDALADYDSVLFVRFAKEREIRRLAEELRKTFGLTEAQTIGNENLLALSGQSGTQFVLLIYTAAAILFVLVLTAAIIMIAASLNSSVAQRTAFFGLLRCTGATAKQVMRLVYREALGWCLFAVPFGVGAGVAVIWILCAVLRALAPEYFYGLPVLGVSVPSIIMGAVVGVLTVLAAAGTPAKRAASVSPLAAVSGSAGHEMPVYRAADTRFCRVYTALGIRHAAASRRNLFLMAGSFAFSIILFLSFYVTVDFMRHAVNPLKPWTPDLSVIGPDNTCTVPEELARTLAEDPAVRRAFGRCFAFGVPADSGAWTGTADLVSYEENQFGWAGEYLTAGSMQEVIDGNDAALLVYTPDSLMKVGDTVTLEIGGKEKELRIAGLLSGTPFDSTAGTERLVCSEETFRRLTGWKDYTIIDVQLRWNAADEDAERIRRMAGEGFTFSDRRMGNRNVQGACYCFFLFIYGFLAVIGFITVFNIINSVAMGVSARMKLYGAFRAIGMSTKQLAGMVAAEAAAYTAVGSLLGIGLGMLCNRVLYDMLVTSHWGDAWRLPLGALAVILSIIALSVALAVAGPIRRLGRMSIVDTIGAQ